jgi:hypothetical protein
LPWSARKRYHLLLLGRDWVNTCRNPKDSCSIYPSIQEAGLVVRFPDKSVGEARQNYPELWSRLLPVFDSLGRTIPKILSPVANPPNLMKRDSTKVTYLVLKMPTFRASLPQMSSRAQPGR